MDWSNLETRGPYPGGLAGLGRGDARGYRPLCTLNALNIAKKLKISQKTTPPKMTKIGKKVIFLASSKKFMKEQIFFCK